MMRSTGFTARVDWERASAILHRERPKRFTAFPRGPGGQFKLEQRRQWVSWMAQERSLGRIDQDSVLPYVANQVLLSIKELGSDVVLYGIHKKGGSLLEELAEAYPFIGGHTVVYDSQDTQGAVSGRDVLIIDDSIHTGQICRKHVTQLRRQGAKQVAVFVIVSSLDGLAAARRLNIRIRSVVEVREEFFTLAFALVMVPMLGLFRNGALSNRPHRSFWIDTGDMAHQPAALRCLRMLTRASCFGRISEVPAVDGRRAAVFAMRAELSAALFRQLRSRLARCGGIDQTKFRIFISRLNGGFHLCVCGIVWPMGSSDLSGEAVMGIAEDAAEWLLDTAEGGLRQAFAGSGFHIIRSEPPLRTSTGSPGRRGSSSPE